VRPHPLDGAAVWARRPDPFPDYRVSDSAGWGWCPASARRRRQIAAGEEALPIHYEMDDEHIVLITIDRPPRNALDMYHFRDLANAWRRFKDDPEAWIAIVTG